MKTIGNQLEKWSFSNWFPMVFIIVCHTLVPCLSECSPKAVSYVPNVSIKNITGFRTVVL
jgi:hypothetical protein